MRRKTVQSLSKDGFHTLSYLEWGEPHPRAPLVCVHGLTRNGRDFDALAAELAFDRQVIVPDMPGRGESDWLPVADEYNFEQYQVDIAVLLARLECSEIDWLGTSMGGMLGILLAARPGSPIRRLILNDVGPVLTRDMRQGIAARLAATPRRFSDLAAASDHFRKALAGFGPLEPKQWRHLIAHSVWALENGGLAPAWDPALAGAFARQAETAVDAWEAWDRIDVPVLILKGETSPILSAETAARMKEGKANVTVVSFPGVGHAPALMSREQIMVIRRWLQG